MSADSEAYRLFLADAKAQGLTTREYEDAYGLVLLPSDREIAEHEATTPFVIDGRSHHCRECASRARAYLEDHRA